MASARALANQEREMQVKRLSRFAKAGLLSVATLMTFATIALLIADRLYRPDAFVIDQLKLTGQFTYLTPEEVQSVVHEEPLGNFFSIELGEIKQRIEGMAWVKHADVRREWPHTLSIRIREHRPVMRWASVVSESENSIGKKSRDQWVSSSGDVISLDKPLQQHSAITLKGTEHDAKQLLTKALAWQKQLSTSKLAIREVSLSASQSWTLTLAKFGEQGPQVFELMLGTVNTEQRLQRFQTLFDTRLFRVEGGLVKVDARYPDGLAVQRAAPSPEPVSMHDTLDIDGADAARQSRVRSRVQSTQRLTAYAT